MIEPLLLIVLYVLTVTVLCLVVQRLPLLAPEAMHRVSTVDGLRGALATAIIVPHFAVTYFWHTGGHWQNSPSRLINNIGVVPVELFFMITGYLFTRRILKGTPRWGDILTARLWRIYPMYLVSVALILAISIYQVGGLQETWSATLQALGRWVIFVGAPLNGLPESIRINATVQWTLLYEAMFYLSLPVLYCLLRLRRPGIACLVAVLALACLWPEYQQHFHTRFLRLFAPGIVVALLEDRLRRTSINFAGWRCTLVAIAFLLASLALKSYSKLQVLLVVVPFALFVLGNSLNGLLENRGLKILGEISFSLYLLHGMVLYCLFSVFSVFDFGAGSFRDYAFYLPLVMVLACALSVATYWGVERPFMLMGQKRRKPAVVAQVSGVGESRG